MNQNKEQSNLTSKPTKTFLIVGIIVAVLNIILRFIKMPIVDLLTQLTSITIIIAIIMLFIKKYRPQSKQYLLGLIGGLVGIGVISFMLTFIIVALKN